MAGVTRAWAPFGWAERYTAPDMDSPCQRELGELGQRTGYAVRAYDRRGKSLVVMVVPHGNRWRVIECARTPPQGIAVDTAEGALELLRDVIDSIKGRKTPKGPAPFTADWDDSEDVVRKGRDAIRTWRQP